MKLRIGFISNSSSSSFVIISKKGELTAKKLVKAFDVGKTSPLYDLAIEMAETLVGCAEKTSLENILEENCVENIKNLPNEIQKALKIKGIIYTGSCSNDSGESAETILCDSGFDYEDDEIVFIKEGGF